MKICQLLNHHYKKYTQVHGMTVGLSFVIQLSNSVKDCLTPSVFFILVAIISLLDLECTESFQ
jgi:hypothetical protein